VWNPEFEAQQAQIQRRYNMTDAPGPAVQAFYDREQQRQQALADHQGQVNAIGPLGATRFGQQGTSMAQRDAYAQNSRYLDQGVADAMANPDRGPRFSYRGKKIKAESPGDNPYDNRYTNLASAFGYPMGTPEDAEMQRQKKLSGESEERIKRSGYRVRGDSGASPMEEARGKLDEYRSRMSKERKERRAARKEGTDPRWSRVMENAKFKGDARRARIERRKSGPSPFEAAFMAGGPEAVFNYMNQQQMMGPQVDKLRSEAELNRANAEGLQGFYNSQQGQVGAPQDINQSLGIPPGSNPVDVLGGRYAGGIPEADRASLQQWAQQAPLRPVPGLMGTIFRGPGAAEEAERHNQLVAAINRGDWPAAEQILRSPAKHSQPAVRERFPMAP
jgi:hypothetical protein